MRDLLEALALRDRRSGLLRFFTIFEGKLQHAPALRHFVACLVVLVCGGQLFLGDWHALLHLVHIEVDDRQLPVLRRHEALFVGLVNLFQLGRVGLR